MTRAILESALQAHLSGDLIKAKHLYLQAISNGTKDPAAFANLGFILKQEGHLVEALEHTKQAISMDPENELFHANAGGIHLQMSNYSLSIEASIQAIKLNPNNPIALANLGTAYRLTGQTQAAKLALTKSLQLQPNNPITITTLGGIELEMDELNKAEKAAFQAIQLDPFCHEALILLGKIKQISGDLNGAKEQFKKALKLNPNAAEAISGLSIDINSPEEAEDLLKTASLCNHQSQSKADQTFLHYGYANCHHKLQNFDLAAEHLATAHQYKLTTAPSEATELINEINFFREYAAPKPNKRSSSNNYKFIFIVGMPRSGSTLLESVLSLQKTIKCLGESLAMGRAVNQFILNTHGKKLNNLPLEKLYLTETKADITENIAYILDKQLYNFKYAGIIASQFTQPKIIHCKRHPLDNILSISRSNLMHGNNYGSSPLDSAKVLIEQEKAMSCHKKQFKDDFYTFNYDSFVNKPKSTLEPLLSWLGLKWEDKYIQPQNNSRNIKTASIIQARKPISNKSLGGWKNYKSLLEPARDLIKDCGLFNDFELNI